MKSITTKTRAGAARSMPAGDASYLAARAAAIFRLCFAADRLSLVAAGVESVLKANLEYLGHVLLMTVKATYSDYSPSAQSFGTINCSVVGEFARASLSNVQVQSLLEGLPLDHSYGMPSRLGAFPGLLTFSLRLDKEDCKLALFLATLEQERAFTKALEAMRAQVQVAGVAKELSASTTDGKGLERERQLQEDIADLERQLEDKREELASATIAADKVRKRLRETASPAMDNLVHQVNDLRERVGKKLLA